MALQIRQTKKCLEVIPFMLKVGRFINGKIMSITEEHIKNKLQKELEATHVVSTIKFGTLYCQKN